MYTLILFFSLTAGNMDGGVALDSQNVPNVGTLKECREAGNQAITDLQHATNTRHVAARGQNAIVKFTCIPTAKK